MCFHPSFCGLPCRWSIGSCMVQRLIWQYSCSLYTHTHHPWKMLTNYFSWFFSMTLSMADSIVMYMWHSHWRTAACFCFRMVRKCMFRQYSKHEASHFSILSAQYNQCCQQFDCRPEPQYLNDMICWKLWSYRPPIMTGIMNRSLCIVICLSPWFLEKVIEWAAKSGTNQFI